jgi:hypothetical protein
MRASEAGGGGPTRSIMDTPRIPYLDVRQESPVGDNGRLRHVENGKKGANVPAASKPKSLEMASIPNHCYGWPTESFYP